MPEELKIEAPIEAPQNIETLPGSPDERPDLKLEQENKVIEKTDKSLEPAKVTPAIVPNSVISAYEEREKQIENFLARGLEEIYLGLPLEKQVEFRKTGEETAEKINKLLENTKINIGKIVNLIRKWLSMLPGINKYFLEQEAKIKADEIIKLKSRDL